MRIEPMTWVAIPIGIVVVFILGGVFSLLTGLHQWGIATPFVFVVWIFLVAFATIQLARIGRIHRESVGAFFGLILLVGYIFGELYVAAMIDQVSITQWYSSRWGNGVELFGTGSFAIKGWLWALAYGCRVLILMSVLWLAPAMEGARQFCSLCRTSTTKTRWKSTVQSFNLDMLKDIQMYTDLIKLQPQSSATHGVRLRVRTCKCKNLGEIKAETHNVEKDTHGQILFDGIPISPIGFCKLVEWVEIVDPNADLPNDRLKLDQFGANRVVFDRDIVPDNGTEWATLIRWTGAEFGLNWRCDTEYTRDLRKLLMGGDHQSAEESLAMVSNINDRACIYEAVSDWSSPQDWMDIWRDEQPESTEAWTVHGIHLIKQAWIKRGGGWVPKNYSEFQSLLHQAMDSLHTATKIDPSNRVAHAWKIYAAKGIGCPKEEVTEYFERATEDEPDFFAAHEIMFDYLTDKWHGSHEECLAFAFRALDNCPKGSPVASMPLYAFLELAAIEVQTDKKNGFKSYMARPGISKDIVRANAKVFDQHSMSMVTPQVRAMCAYMLWKCGELQLAKNHLEIIGKTTEWDPFAPTALIWSKDSIKSARKDCGL